MERQGITKVAKKKRVHSLVFSLFIYTIETRTVLASDCKEIDAFEMWWNRIIAHCTNISILRVLNISQRLYLKVKIKTHQSYFKKGEWTRKIHSQRSGYWQVLKKTFQVDG